MNPEHPVQDSWQSDLDKKFFREKKSEYDVLIMGMSTFKLSGTYYWHQQDIQETQQRHIVLSNNAAESKENQIDEWREFYSGPLSEIIENHTHPNEKILIVGGATLYTAGITARLIQDFYITMEKNVRLNEEGNATPLLLDGRQLEDIPFKRIDFIKKDPSTEIRSYHLNY